MTKRVINFADCFRCEACGFKFFTEVKANVTASSGVYDIWGKDNVCYDPPTNTGGEVIRYECVKCGKPILDENGYIVKEEKSMVAIVKARSKKKEE